MVRKLNPLMIAYIVFLVICAVVYVIADTFKLEFENWNKIIVAVTISSYFFSISSMYKPSLVLGKELLNDALMNKKLIRENMVCEKKIEEIIDYNINKKDSVKDIDKNIEFCKKKNKRDEALIMIFDVLGFLVFFCIMTFQKLYDIFEQAQEFYTITAFIAVLIAEYVEPILLDKTKKLSKTYTDILKNYNQNLQKLVKEEMDTED